MSVKILEAVMPHMRNEDWSKLDAALDAATLGASREDRAAIAYWRALSLIRQERPDDALESLKALRHEFFCKSLCDTKAANILHHSGRREEALAMAALAVANCEDESFPGLAREAKFYRCLYLARAGVAPPADLMDALPDDYRSMELDDGFVTKKDILALSRKIAGSP